MDAPDVRRTGMRKTNAPVLSVVIATWNSANEITDCLHTLRVADPAAEIFVVDNASTDATVELVRTDFPLLCCWRTKSTRASLVPTIRR